MKTKTGNLVVEDHDTAYLFLNPAGIEEAETGVRVEVTIADGVNDWKDEDDVVWLSDETCEKIRVVRRETVWNDEGDLLISFEDCSPIPIPIIVDDAAAWGVVKREFEPGI